jgi:predicted ABC-class ATPase
MSTTSELVERLMLLKKTVHSVGSLDLLGEAADRIVELEDDTERLHKLATDRYEEIIVLKARIEELERENAKKTALLTAVINEAFIYFSPKQPGTSNFHPFMQALDSARAALTPEEGRKP